MSRTSEWVSLGHPDKMADYISEYILDRYLEVDDKVRYALEVMIKNNKVFLGGEITSTHLFSKDELYNFVKEAIKEIGYDEKYNEKWKDYAFNINDFTLSAEVSIQSIDISMGVNNEGWGDQGIFVGYAENNSETNYMPVDLYYARLLGTYLYNQAKENNLGGLDIKTQITVNDEDKITDVIVAIPCLSDEEKNLIISNINQFLNTPQFNTDNEFKLIVNGTGAYTYHSSIGDCGITGRKLAVDFYGGNSPIGGGSPWTKDPTKADLSLNLLARDVAVKYILTNDNPNLHHIITKTSSCIGKNKCIFETKFYDKNGNVIDKREFASNILPSNLIRDMNLNKPIYTILCRKGLFSLIWNLKS